LYFNFKKKGFYKYVLRCITCSEVQRPSPPLTTGGGEEVEEKNSSCGVKSILSVDVELARVFQAVVLWAAVVLMMLSLSLSP